MVVYIQQQEIYIILDTCTYHIKNAHLFSHVLLSKTQATLQNVAFIDIWSHDKISDIFQIKQVTHLTPLGPI